MPSIVGIYIKTSSVATMPTVDNLYDVLVRLEQIIGLHGRAKSVADFINKLKIIEEKADESLNFLKILFTISERDHVELKRLLKEANKLLALTIASINTRPKKIKKVEN